MRAEWGWMQISTEQDGFGAGDGVETRRDGDVVRGGWGPVGGWRRAEEGGNKGVSLDGFPRPPFYRTPTCPVSALAYLRGRGLRPWAQSVLSVAGAATSPASPAAPLAASRRIRAETGPCASPGGRRGPAVLRARPRAPPFARRAGTRTERWGQEDAPSPAPPGASESGSLGLRGQERKLLLSLLSDPLTGIGKERPGSPRGIRFCPENAPPPSDCDFLGAEMCRSACVPRETCLLGVDSPGTFVD